jgi:tetratricopeptide (TPR) repeat protein
MALSAQEKKDNKQKGDEKPAEEKGGKAEKGDKGEKAGKPDVRAVDVDGFRKSKDPAVVEIITLYDQIDKWYTELATAKNVAAGDDREARKAKGDVKAYETKIRRQLGKLEDAVDKYTKPLEKAYDQNKSQYDALRGKAEQYEKQGQDKKATDLYQQADRYTGKMEGAKRQLDTAKSFLYFESAQGMGNLGGGDDDDDDGRAPRDKRGKSNRFDKGEKADKGGND